MIVAEAVVAVGNGAQQTEVYDWLRPLAGYHLATADAWATEAP